MRILEYEQGAIKEIQHISKSISGVMTMRQYNVLANKPYKFEAIRDRLQWTFNKLKTVAGLPINKQKSPGNIKCSTKENNATERLCNMDDCNKLFMAIDHMRSCPKCTDAKRSGNIY